MTLVDVSIGVNLLPHIFAAVYIYMVHTNSGNKITVGTFSRHVNGRWQSARVVVEIQPNLEREVNLWLNK